MATQIIAISDYCTFYKVTPDFIESLEDAGIVYFNSDGTTKFIADEQLQELERYRMLHFELQINVEGLDAIKHLLERQAALQQEIEDLRSTLRIYSSE